jgi:hypothetical protein
MVAKNGILTSTHLGTTLDKNGEVWVLQRNLYHLGIQHLLLCQRGVGMSACIFLPKIGEDIAYRPILGIVERNCLILGLTCRTVVNRDLQDNLRMDGVPFDINISAEGRNGLILNGEEGLERLHLGGNKQPSPCPFTHQFFWQPTSRLKTRPL